MLNFEIVPAVEQSDLEELLENEGIEVGNLARFLWEDKYENDSYKCLCFRINGEVVQFNELFYEDKEEAKMVNAIYKVLDKVIPSQFDCILVDVSW